MGVTLHKQAAEEARTNEGLASANQELEAAMRLADKILNARIDKLQERLAKKIQAALTKANGEIYQAVLDAMTELEG